MNKTIEVKVELLQGLMALIDHNIGFGSHPANELRSLLCAQQRPLEVRMKDVGMMTVAEMLTGAPMDVFTRHAGVNDLASFGQWLEMKRKEYTEMQARFVLDGREKDELYEWVFAHSAVFGEVHVNFKAAYPAPNPSSTTH